MKPVRIVIDKQNLLSVSYSFSEINLKDNYTIDVVDVVNVKQVNDDGFDLDYTRKTLSNEPFMFEVVFGVTVKNINKEDLAENNETVSEYAERIKKDIVLKLALPTRASLLISNITKESGGAFISSPNFILEKKNK